MKEARSDGHVSGIFMLFMLFMSFMVQNSITRFGAQRGSGVVCIRAHPENPWSPSYRFFNHRQARMVPKRHVLREDLHLSDLSRSMRRDLTRRHEATKVPKRFFCPTIRAFPDAARPQRGEDFRSKVHPNSKHPRRRLDSQGKDALLIAAHLGEPGEADRHILAATVLVPDCSEGKRS